MKKSMKSVALVLMLAFVMVTLVACGGADKPAETPGDQPATAEGEAVTLVLAQGADPRGLDPALVDDGESSKVMCQIYEGLLKFAQDGTEVLPSLAKSWDISDDGLEYVFHLEEGVLFHDGTPFNAEAVKFNIERQLPPKATADMPYGEFVYGSVANVEAIDELTVKVTLKEPSTPFLNNLAMSMSAPMVSPTALEANNNNVNEDPVGTGPFVFETWHKGQDILLKANENYWGEAPKASTIVFRFIPENSARAVALTTGEVDIIDGIDPTIVAQIEKGGKTVDKTEGMNISYLGYNTTRAPFDNPEVRRALSQAVNVTELVDSLYQGYATPATTILPSFVPGYSADVAQVAYDAQAATAALAEAGVSEVHIITYTNPRPYNPANGQALAEAIQTYYSKVGVTAKIDAYDWTTYKEKIAAGDYDICFYGWIGDNGDPDNFMSLLMSEDATMNVARYKDATFNDMLAQALKTPNGPERNKLYADMEQYVADQAVWLPLSHMQQLTAYNPAVQNYYYHATGNIYMSQMYK